MLCQRCHSDSEEPSSSCAGGRTQDKKARACHPVKCLAPLLPSAPVAGLRDSNSSLPFSRHLQAVQSLESSRQHTASDPTFQRSRLDESTAEATEKHLNKESCALLKAATVAIEEIPTLEEAARLPKPDAFVQNLAHFGGMGKAAPALAPDDRSSQHLACQRHHIACFVHAAQGHLARAQEGVPADDESWYALDASPQCCEHKRNLHLRICTLPANSTYRIWSSGAHPACLANPPMRIVQSVRPCPA